MFTNRRQAGRRLAARLEHLRGQDAVVLGLPRGGVPVAYEVARALDAPLDVIIVRKLGVPGMRELAMGAVGENGVIIRNQPVISADGITDAEFADVRRVESARVRERAALLRAGRPSVSLAGRTVIVVDDGVATGSTAQAACRVARMKGAARIVLAVPVGAPDALDLLRTVADEVIAVETPSLLRAIGAWYDDFDQVADDEVIELLGRSRADARAASPTGGEVRVPVDGVTLAASLAVPSGATGVVIFVHGSGSSRYSPRNAYVARRLNDAAIATVLFDLLTVAEESDRANVFDIGLIAARLTEVTAWVRAQPWSAGTPIGWFGASTGGGAALWAAAEPGADVAAIVSRGGRPDLAGDRLLDVRAPTLLIVGGDDDVVLDLNRAAAARLRCTHRLSIVPGATHLFEEPGTLATMAYRAGDWFAHYLAVAARHGVVHAL
jgi:putative phosphoribosyl transferase